MINFKSKLTRSKFDNLLRCFAYDVSATQAGKICQLNRNTVNRYYLKFRELIEHSQNEYHIEKTICEVDESYFGGKRIRGKRGRGAYGKKIVFGIIERGGAVYTEVVPNCKSATLTPIIESHIAKDCVVNSDGWKAYKKLKKLGYKHNKINHNANIFAKGAVHTNSIENFWGYSKQRLSKFHGIDKQNFRLHIKECEYRFNHRKKDIYECLKEIVNTSLFL